jgi:N-acetylmuramoyl-L-alanine amidase
MLDAPADDLFADLDAAIAADVDVGARTIFGEARGEPLKGQIAVAGAIMNRVRIDFGDDGRDDWWGEGVQGVCLAGKGIHQFSCWDANSPGLVALKSVKPGSYIFDVCRLVMFQAIKGLINDPTGGATHYHAKWAMPYWAIGRTPCAVIGNHLFYQGKGLSEPA